MHRPEHACALLRDRRGRLVLQLRPASARHAPSQLTCFGGKREADESAEACLLRELAEEIGWAPPAAHGATVDLRSGERWIARFFALDLPDGAALRPEPGSVIIRAALPSLAGLPLSPWHRAAIAGWVRRADAVEVPTS